MKKQKKQEQRRIALDRINQLFAEAEGAFKKHPERSNRYVELARKISMRIRVRIPRELKRRFCKHCNAYLVPGANCRVRTKKNMVVYFCLNCKKYMRIPFIREKKLKREVYST